MLSVLALRLAAIEALRPTACVLSDVGWPTLARTQVLDSRLDPIDDLAPATAQPVIAVYTQEADGLAGEKRGGPPFLVTVDLVFEFSVVVMVPDDADPGVYVPANPQTDAELEAALDLVEAQIFFCLLYGPTGQLWRNICGRRVHAPRSVPHRTSEEGVRLARRTMTWKTEVAEDCFDPAPLTAPSGFEIFPEPLRSLALALPAQSYAISILRGLAADATAPVMPLATPLQEVVMGVTVAADGAQPPDTASVTAASGNTGNGTVGTVTVASGTRSGSYTIEFASATAFGVVDPNGWPVGSGTVGVAFAGGGLGFTITAGETAFVAGDAFTIALAQATQITAEVTGLDT
jgi:hypothetical protein